LGVEDGAKLSSEFEWKSELEIAESRTSFDYHIQSDSGWQVFVEVKYTEEGFGKAKLDDEHKKKFVATYSPLLRLKSKFFEPICDEVIFFLSHYQILRNLVHISDTDIVVLLFPKANRLVAEQAEYARSELLNDEGRARLKIVFLEEFVAYLEDHCKGGRLDGYYQDFRAKYLPVKS
jgi:hypothetical protein